MARVTLQALFLTSRVEEAQLWAKELGEAGFDPKWVRSDNEDDYRNQLTGTFDILLSEDRLPQLSTARALHLLEVSGANIPFLIVSDRPDIAGAVAAIRQGAADYLSRDCLSLVLSAAVTEALRRKEERTERHLAEARQKTVADVFRNVVEHSLVGIQILQHGKYYYANKKLGELFGYTPSELLDLESWTAVVAEVDRDKVMDQIRRRVSGETPFAQYYFRGLRKDGEVIDVEVRSDRTELNGQPAVIGTLIDVTERRRAEEVLRESEERFRSAFERTNVAMVHTDLDHRFVRANAAFAHLFGYSNDEILKLSMIDITHPDDRAESYESRIPLLAGKNDFFQLEKRYLRKDGQILWGLTNVSLLRRADGQPHLYVGQVQDLTESKRLEEQLRQSQKMEAIGRLAGGIAHDFNNLLTVINGYSEIIADELRSENPLCKFAEEIRGAGVRASNLTRQLLAFSRQQVLMPVTLEVNGLLREIQNMLGRLIGEDIELQFVQEPQLWPIRADASQIEQVIMNLVVNARDAMPHGGKLTIETKNAELDETYVEMHREAQPGQYAMIAVSDSGCGMEKSTRVRIFEPFFTTKGGKGTGLGLSTVYGIVRQSGGHIEVYSKVGLGTTFKIYLHRDRSAAKVSPEHPETSVLPRGDETILLVEDEDSVRALARLILQKSGYRVIEARDGAEAFSLISQDPLVHLLVTDVVMPQMNGRELAQRLQMLHSNLKVLYMSGYTDDAIVRHGVLETHMNFLQKPYTGGSLTKKVREVLDAGCG
jgi:two-component system cell cycle sensor histidine kinase/response regulator CckA